MGDCPGGGVLEGGEVGEREGERVSVVGAGIDDEVFYFISDLQAVLALTRVLVVDFHGNGWGISFIASLVSMFAIGFFLAV